MPPPAAPNGSTGDWQAAEKSLGTPLPADYREIVEAYGAGFVCKFLLVNSPFDSEMNLIRQWTSYSKIFARTNPKLPLFPKPAGLLFCSTTKNGDWLFWKTGGDPDKWDIVFNRNETSEFERMRNTNFTGFILDFIAGKNKTLKYATDAFCKKGELFTTFSRE